MHHRRPLVVLFLAAAVLLAGLVATLSPLWPGPATPDGATPLRLQTAASHLIPNLDCPTAALAPAKIATDGDALILVARRNCSLMACSPRWAAWRRDGKAELVDRNGDLIGREGDVIDAYGGGTGPDGRFYVCVVGG